MDINPLLRERQRKRYLVLHFSWGGWGRPKNPESGFFRNHFQNICCDSGFEGRWKPAPNSCRTTAFNLPQAIPGEFIGRYRTRSPQYAQTLVPSFWIPFLIWFSRLMEPDSGHGLRDLKKSNLSRRKDLQVTFLFCNGCSENHSVTS